MAAVAMLTSCSDDERVGTAADVPVGFSDVPIRLSSGGATRASIESDDNGLFETDSIGIFALAKSVMEVNPSPIDITWGDEAPGSHTYAVLLDNEMANAVKDGGQTRTDITFADGQQHYYPTGNWYCYSFYGYHPFTDNIEATDSQRVAVVTLTGKEDLIYGKAASDEPYAYSARYFRQAGNEEKVPEMQFSHKLMRITFSAVAGPDTDGGSTYVNAQNMTIESIRVLGVPAEARLVIADMAHPENEGTVTYGWDDTEAMADFTLLDSDDQKLNPESYYMQVEEGGPVEITVGQGVLLPVPEAGDDYKYRVAVTLRDRAGTLYPCEYPQELRLEEGRQFEAGKSYNVKLTINGPKAISLSAKLSKWESEDGALGDLTF